MNYMILSVDTGIDDALAIAYALGQKTYRLLGNYRVLWYGSLRKNLPQYPPSFKSHGTSGGSCLSGQQRAASGNPYL